MVPTPLGIPASGWMTFWYSEVVEIVDVYYRTRIKNTISKGGGRKAQEIKSRGNHGQGPQCPFPGHSTQLLLSKHCSRERSPELRGRISTENHGHWHTVPTGLNCAKFHIPRENRHSPEPLQHKYLDKLLWQGPGPQACTVLLWRQTFPKLAPWSSRLWWRQACNLPCCIEWVPFYPMLSIVLKNPNLTLFRRFKDTVL